MWDVHRPASPVSLMGEYSGRSVRSQSDTYPTYKYFPPPNQSCYIVFEPLMASFPSFSLEQQMLPSQGFVLDLSPCCSFTFSLSPVITFPPANIRIVFAKPPLPLPPRLLFLERSPAPTQSPICNRLSSSLSLPTLLNTLGVRPAGGVGSPAPPPRVVAAPMPVQPF